MELVIPQIRGHTSENNGSSYCTRSQTANIENQKPTRREGNIVQLSGRIQSVKATEDWCREEGSSCEEVDQEDYGEARSRQGAC